MSTTLQTVRSSDDPIGGAGVKCRVEMFVLIAACLAQFMVVLDNAVVYVAIPKMSGSLSLSASGQQWVINAYALMFGGFLLLGGRLSDLFGQRRVFVIGTTVFTISSFICGVSQDQLMIELARGLQGIGGAIMAPTSLSLITTVFTAPEERSRAIGTWAAVAAGGSAAGVLIGGVLTSAISWRWVFFVNVPVGIFIVLVASTQISLPRRPVRRQLDVIGGLLGTTGLGLIIYAVIGADVRGWGAPTTVGLLGGGLLVLFVFLLVESRFAADPILPLSLFEDRRRTAANGLTAIAGALIFYQYFVISLHLQRIDHENAITTGVSFLPVTVATMVAAIYGRRLITHLGLRRQLLLGAALQAAGFAWLSQIGVHAEYWTHIGLPMLLLGIGLGIVFVPNTVAATANVETRHAGAASGLVNTSRQIGGAIGLAALTAIASASSGARPSALAMTRGDSTALWICAGLAAVGMGLALLAGSPRQGSDLGRS